MIHTLGRILREEWFLALSLGTGGAIMALGQHLAESQATPAGLALTFVWLFAVALGSSLAVVRHAEHLAARLGEPYGTLILTIAVTTIEVVSISAVGGTGEHNPAVVRDTIFAVVMILLNLMVGLSLLLGGWRHLEQQYNSQGANAYLGVIIPLTVLSLILPNFTMTTPGPTLSTAQEAFVGAVSIGLYLAFLGVQTVRHRSYFLLGAAAEDAHDPPPGTARGIAGHAFLLILYMIPLVFLAEQLALPVNASLAALRAPSALGGIVIALLVATPEAVSAVRAAVANRLQRSMNIFLGSVLATIGLTIPSMIALSWLTGEKIALGLQNGNAVMLVLTLAVSMITFSGGPTNVLQGTVHLVLFAAYILLLFEG
jgi:Ca2+:H+ antiporter